jgi:proteasome lid subunit RPN8/RPN11
MKLHLSAGLLAQIHAHGEDAYPEEGAGFLLGRVDGELRTGILILPASNSREDAARKNRYQITPQENLKAEELATARGLDVIGIFHSHPDHPNHPSDFDREWALPWYSYLITSVNKGKAVETRSWRLTDDRSKYSEEEIAIIEPTKEN